jgi:hypothetical protein
MPPRPSSHAGRVATEDPTSQTAQAESISDLVACHANGAGNTFGATASDLSGNQPAADLHRTAATLRNSLAVGFPEASEGSRDVAKQELCSRKRKFVMPPRAWQPAADSHCTAAPCFDRIDRRTLLKLVQSVQMDVGKLKEAHEAAEAAMSVSQTTPTEILRLLALLPDKVAIAAGIPTDALQQAAENKHAMVSFLPRDLSNFRFKIHQFLTDMRFGNGARVRAHRASLAADRAKESSTPGEPVPASSDSAEETDTDSN